MLKVIAVSAPEYPYGRLNSKSLTSRDPVSLYNAGRYAAFLADSRIGCWGDSNWAASRKNRKQNFLLMNSLAEDLSYYEELLAREGPNLLLIGAMTVCLPGAIECARVAREMFGEEILIVLGGRHVNETMFLTKDRSEVKHHNGSPLLLMLKGKIGKLFDLVIAGEGEFIIAKLGEIVDRVSSKQPLTESVFRNINEDESELRRVPGMWTLGSVKSGKIKTIISDGIPIDKDKLPSPVSMFGVSSGFAVFENALTGHAFSDIGPGCIYDCGFCSERNSVCGPLQQLETSSNRLYRQLADIKRVIAEDAPGFKASAFVEDSIMLAGLTSQLSKLAEMLRSHPLDLKFGGQLTVDLAIKQKKLLEELRPLGLEYLFIGLETLDPRAVGGMNKDVNKRNWIKRAQTVIEEMAKLDFSIGLSVLFGLGENQKHRLSLIRQISRWQEVFGNPKVVSFNWAVQHPLQGNDNGCGYDYIGWGINSSEYLEALKDYGEASIIYSLANIKAPALSELAEINVAKKTIEARP